MKQFNLLFSLEVVLWRLYNVAYECVGGCDAWWQHVLISWLGRREMLKHNFGLLLLHCLNDRLNINPFADMMYLIEIFTHFKLCSYLFALRFQLFGNNQIFHSKSVIWNVNNQYSKVILAVKGLNQKRVNRSSLPSGCHIFQISYQLCHLYIMYVITSCIGSKYPLNVQKVSQRQNHIIVCLWSNMKPSFSLLTKSYSQGNFASTIFWLFSRISEVWHIV